MGAFEDGVAVGFILGVFTGLIVGWTVAQFFVGSTAKPKQYSNVESWEIVKDDRGRVRAVKVTRNAKES